MALDSRAIRAKQVLRRGVEKGKAARNRRGANRSTATRAQYQHGHDAAVAALEILCEQPKKRR